MRVAVESLAQARLELGDAAFENEGGQEVGLLGVIEVAEEIREERVVGAGDERGAAFVERGGWRVSGPASATRSAVLSTELLSGFR